MPYSLVMFGYILIMLCSCSVTFIGIKATIGPKLRLSGFK